MQIETRGLRWWEAALAWVGVILGFLAGIIWGVIAAASLARYKAGTTPYPTFAVILGGFFLVVPALILLADALGLFGG